MALKGGNSGPIGTDAALFNDRYLNIELADFLAGAQFTKSFSNAHFDAW